MKATLDDGRHLRTVEVQRVTFNGTPLEAWQYVRDGDYRGLGQRCTVRVSWYDARDGGTLTGNFCGGDIMDFASLARTLVSQAKVQGSKVLGGLLKFKGAT